MERARCVGQAEQIAGHGEEHAEEQSDDELTAENPLPVAEPAVTGREGGDHERGRLVARVTAAGDHEGDEGDKPGVGRLPAGEHHRGDRGGREQDREPDAPLPGHRDQRRLEVALTERGDGGDPLGVVGGILPDGVEYVVVRDDPHEAATVIDHGDRDEVESGQLLDHVFAGFLDADADHVLLHQFRDEGRGPREDQVAERHKAKQPAFGIEHVNVVDRLTVGRLRSQAADRLACRDLSRQRRILRRHH